MNAAQEVQAALEPRENVEGIVFGAWGWGSINEEFEPGYGEPEPPPVPPEQRGKVLSWAEAKEYMQTWSFRGGYGSPKCYAVWIWTNKRIFWVTQYDGSTKLNYAPRNPGDTIPRMPGG